MIITITMPTTDYTAQIERLASLGMPQEIIAKQSTNRTRIVATVVEPQLNDKEEFTGSRTSENLTEMCLSVKSLRKSIKARLDELVAKNIISQYK